MLGPFTITLALAISLGSGVPKPVTITGCLEKGDEKGEFHLTTKDGKVYDVKGTAVPLAQHVGHTMTISGKLVAPEPGEEKQGEAGEVEVTEMKHLSGTCQK
jgi:hypothetical protein